MLKKVLIGLVIAIAVLSIAVLGIEHVVIPTPAQAQTVVAVSPRLPPATTMDWRMHNATVVRYFDREANVVCYRFTPERQSAGYSVETQCLYLGVR